MAFLRRSLTSCWLQTFFPALCMARNSSATAHAVSRSWTWLKDVGGDIFSVGPQETPCRLTVLYETSPPIDSLRVCNGPIPVPFRPSSHPLIRRTQLLSQRQYSPSFNVSQAPGPAGSLSLLHHHAGRLSRLSWCWGGLFCTCRPSMAASCGFSCSGPRMGPTSRPRPVPSSRAFASLLVSSAHMLWISPSTVPTLTLKLVRWWGLARHGHDPCPVGGRPARHRGARSCMSFLSQHTRRPHSLPHELSSFRRSSYAVVSSSTHCTSRSLPHRHSTIGYLFQLCPANTFSAVRAQVRFVGR